MAITYGYFNSVNGDRTYNADQMSEYFDGLVSNGVYESVGGALQVKAITGGGMSVQVMSGRAIINCKWLNNDAPITLDITQAHGTLARWTAVVVRLDVTNRLMTITTKDGTPASTPERPAMDNTSTIVEICLAYVFVGPRATSITQSLIEDRRPSDLCGWVTGLIEQVDTSTLFDQYKTGYDEFMSQMFRWQQMATEAFYQWFQTLTQDLNVNTFNKRYRKKVVYNTTGTMDIPLNMAGYSYSMTDIITVYINGLLAESGTDYVFNANTLMVTPTATAEGTVVVIEILKSKIGFEILAGNGYAVTDENNNHIGI